MPKKLKTFFLNAFVMLITILFLIPIYWLIISSFKTGAEVTAVPVTLFPQKIIFDNFYYVWKFLKFDLTFLNTILVCVPVTFFIVVFSTMAGYALAKKEFPGKNMVMSLLIATMVIPATVLLLPLFFIINSFGMYDSLLGLVIPFSVTVFGIFFMKQYISDIPDDIIKAANIDGASEFQIFTKVILPLSKPGIMTLAIIEFVNNWNSFTMPLVLINSPDKYTLPLKLTQLVQSQESLNWAQIMAANLLTVIPVIIIFLILQKYIIKGVMAGAVKG